MSERPDIDAIRKRWEAASDDMACYVHHEGDIRKDDGDWTGADVDAIASGKGDVTVLLSYIAHLEAAPAVPPTRRDQLDELTRLTEEFGGYDAEFGRAAAVPLGLSAEEAGPIRWAVVTLGQFAGRPEAARAIATLSRLLGKETP